MFERESTRRYCEWSTVVDAPISWLMPLSMFEEHIRDEYGAEGLRALPARLERVHATGTSMHNHTRDELIAGNRAGPGETELTAEEICDRYEVGGAYWRECEVKR